MNNQISIRTIAQECGVSAATVSRVINNTGRFSQETEKRVKEALEKYNYQPNQLAKGLRTNKTKTVGLIVPDITNEFFSVLIQNIQVLLMENGYQLIICNTNESSIIEKKSLYLLQAQNACGLMYINGTGDLENTGWDIPAVYIDRNPPSEKAPNEVFISSDNYHGGYLAGRELVESGCKNIMVITERSGSINTIERLDGCRKALSDVGLSISEDAILTPSEITLKCAYQLTYKALNSGNQFDGVFCETDMLALGAMMAALDCGLSIPGDLKLMGFDDISTASICRIPLSTIRQDIRKIGVTAVESLLRMIRGEITEQRVTLPILLIRRNTTLGYS